jgi:hypothetical protein
MFLIIYTALLFFVLSPNVLLRLPPKGNKYIVAAVHAVIFALLWHFTHKLIERLFRREGFEEGTYCGTAIKNGDISEDGMFKCENHKWVKNSEPVKQEGFKEGGVGSFLDSGLKLYNLNKKRR